MGPLAGLLRGKGPRRMLRGCTECAWGCADDARRRQRGTGTAQNALEAVLRMQEGVRGGRGHAECA